MQFKMNRKDYSFSFSQDDPRGTELVIIFPSTE